MTKYTQRFGVGNPAGPRSSEWFVSWHSHNSEVYIATRLAGVSMKASIHESGECHVKAPDQRFWRGRGSAPRLLDIWHIDPQNSFEFPFGLIFPGSELREGDWARFRRKPTTWIPACAGEYIEIAVFLLDGSTEYRYSLSANGWHTVIVDELLPDGRRLLVVAGFTRALESCLEELEQVRNSARQILNAENRAYANPRSVILAGAGRNTRRFIEIAI